MWYVIKEDELYHHGILGQKWGVRRFQNYDGTYTQAGLKRYNKSSDQYNKTVHDYKTGKASKYEVKSARKKMNSDYRQLKRDKLADQGKELYKKGKRITSNTSALAVAGVASAFGGTAAYKIVRNYASEKSCGNQRSFSGSWRHCRKRNSWR